MCENAEQLFVSLQLRLCYILSLIFQNLVIRSSGAKALLCWIHEVIFFQVVYNFFCHYSLKDFYDVQGERDWSIVFWINLLSPLFIGVLDACFDKFGITLLSSECLQRM